MCEVKKCIECTRYKEQADSFPCCLCANDDERPYYESVFSENVNEEIQN